MRLPFLAICGCMVLCGHHHRPPPEHLHLPKLKLSPLNDHSPSPAPPSLVTPFPTPSLESTVPGPPVSGTSQVCSVPGRPQVSLLRQGSPSPARRDDAPLHGSASAGPVRGPLSPGFWSVSRAGQSLGASVAAAVWFLMLGMEPRSLSRSHPQLQSLCLNEARVLPKVSLGAGCWVLGHQEGGLGWTPSPRLDEGL